MGHFLAATEHPGILFKVWHAAPVPSQPISFFLSFFLSCLLACLLACVGACLLFTCTLSLSPSAVHRPRLPTRAQYSPLNKIICGCCSKVTRAAFPRLYTPSPPTRPSFPQRDYRGPPAPFTTTGTNHLHHNYSTTTTKTGLLQLQLPIAIHSQS